MSGPAVPRSPQAERTSIMTFHVDSEVGQLKQVIVHRPGVELSRLTPGNVDELLFDDVMWAHRAREEHDAFVAQLRGSGCHRAPLRDSARRGAGRAGCTGVPPGPAHHRDPVRPRPRRAPRRAGRLDAGRPAGRPADRRRAQARRHSPAAHPEPADGVPASRTTSCSGRSRTTCSSATTRHGSTTAYPSTRWPNPPASGRRSTPGSSTTSTRCSRPRRCTFLYGNDSSSHEPATIEGGDITVIGNRAVMIGMGERTTPQGVETLARSLFRAGSVDTVIVVELPEGTGVHASRHRHDDDRPGRVLRLPLPPDELRSFTLTADRRRRRLQDRGERRPVPRGRGRPRHRQAPGPADADRQDGRRSASSGTTATTSWRCRPA